MVSSKAVLEDLNLKLRSAFNHGFICYGCLHCDILKNFYSFKEKRAHKGKKIFLKWSKWDFWHLTAYWINSKMRNRYNNTPLMILYCHHCWSFLWCNYWRSSMLLNSTSSSHSKVTVHIQLALYTCDPFLKNNCNMIGNSVEKHCFVVLNYN